MAPSGPASSHWAWEGWPAERRDFKVAIVCNSMDQFEAVMYTLNEVWAKRSSGYGQAHAEIHEKMGYSQGDHYTYINGRIGRHNVVVALVNPYDWENADHIDPCTGLLLSYPRLRLVLLPGLCAAAPTSPDGDEVLLGDVAIDTFGVHRKKKCGKWYSSDEAKPLAKLIEGKTRRDEFQEKTTHFLRQLQGKAAEDDSYETDYEESDEEFGRPMYLRGEFKTDDEDGDDSDSDESPSYKEWRRAAKDRKEKMYKGPEDRPDQGRFGYPGGHTDVVFECGYHHKHHKPDSECGGFGDCKKFLHNSYGRPCERADRITCEGLGCDMSKALTRKRLQPPQSASAFSPRWHVGRMWSSMEYEGRSWNKTWHELREGGEALGVETEGNGSYWANERDAPQCILVKGVYRYVDNHPSSWEEEHERYAAAAAAAATKVILMEYEPHTRMAGMKEVKQSFFPW